ncbi:hypothetical protein K466DRAFT_659515 [Polyporus arcularius HHB13444]|uniref:Heme haloperoxidase family profile domain-containing protein n=1 Tax=Polyporus arcularius HHB13444 TaxID=1314778 RepID=A0A5C3PRZ3_9APHY|nr:hypothetical protein K466DRAFT_659515 [Polyporus arcularius HHB13444]
MPPSMDDTHCYVAPDASDSRSPCPALNALANHGYLPHDGRSITTSQLVSALRNVYHISLPLATGLALGGVALCGRWSGIRRVLDLHELARHNAVEHDGSLVHDDALSPDALYAPAEVDDALLHQLLSAGSHSHSHAADSASSHSSSDADSESSQYSDEREDRERARERAWREGSLTLEQLCRAQIARWRRARPLDGFHTTLAKGEVALLFSVLGVREDVGAGGASADTSTVANSCPTLGLGHSDELRLDESPRSKNKNTSAPASVPGEQSDGVAEVPIGRPPAALDKRDALVVPKRFVAQWMGEERLPEGWQRPHSVIGVSVIYALLKEIAKLEAPMLEQQVAAEKADVFVERTVTPQ